MPHKSQRLYRKCRCRVWLEWGPDRKRKSAKTRSWEQGEHRPRFATEITCLSRKVSISSQGRFIASEKAGSPGWQEQPATARKKAISL